MMVLRLVRVLPSLRRVGLLMRRWTTLRQLRGLMELLARPCLTWLHSWLLSGKQSNKKSCRRKRRKLRLTGD